MSVVECQERISSVEFTHWKALFMIEAEEEKAAAKAPHTED